MGDRKKNDPKLTDDKDMREGRFRGAMDGPRTDGGYTPPRGPDIAPPGKDPSPDTKPDSAKDNYDDPENASDYGGVSAPERDEEGHYDRDEKIERERRMKDAD